MVISGHIDIKDIIWPGNALKPPEGIPEKRFIRVSFLEEDPYIMLDPPSACSSNKGSDRDEPLHEPGSFDPKARELFGQLSMRGGGEKRFI